MTKSLSSLKIPSIRSPATSGLFWSGSKQTGTYTLAPGLTNYSVYAPNGNTPTQADLATHKYHHHTRCGYGAGRVWVMSSSGGTNEDAPGQMVVCASTADGGTTWTAPTLVFDAQDTFSGTGASYTSTSRILYPRAFVTYGGNLYAVASLDEIVTGTNNFISRALFAALCNSDGSIGTAFRISVADYTPFGALSKIAYDNVLGPALFPRANLLGNWGGSTPSNTASAWTGWASQNGVLFCEPATIDLNGDLSSLLRIWRDVTNGVTTRFWQQFGSYANGVESWGSIYYSDLPNSGSCGSVLKLSDGRIAFVGNPVDSSVSRDPLFLSLHDGSTGVQTAIYAVRQGLSATPTYAGTFKSGGAAYPGICEDGSGNVWISYSMQKETIGMTKIPLSGI